MLPVVVAAVFFLFPRGVDVSSWQRKIDWESVATRAAFAFVRVGDGDRPDARFRENFGGCSSSGMLCGSYHFFRPSDDPEKQAALVSRWLREAGAEKNPIAIDLETTEELSDAEYVNRLRAYVDGIGSSVPGKILVYGGPSFLSKKKLKWLSRYPLWVAHYGTLSPRIPTHWKECTFWQKTDRGTWPGISGRVDVDEVCGGRKVLLRFFS